MCSTGFHSDPVHISLCSHKLNKSTEKWREENVAPVFFSVHYSCNEIVIWKMISSMSLSLSRFLEDWHYVFSHVCVQLTQLHTEWWFNKFFRNAWVDEDMNPPLVNLCRAPQIPNSQAEERHCRASHPKDIFTICQSGMAPSEPILGSEVEVINCWSVCQIQLTGVFYLSYTVF